MKHNFKFFSKPGIIIFSLLVLAFTGSAWAHFPWINLEDYTPGTGSALKLTVGWGHKYPLAGFMKAADLEDMVIIGPEKGSKRKISALSDLEFSSEAGLAEPGAYVVAAKRKTGFYTKTTEGGKRQSKKGLENVIRCSRSHMCVKAVAMAGDTQGVPDAVVGHPMEIIPLAGPSALRPGDYMPVRILLDGKPYKTTIFATYAGFSTEKNVYAYTASTDKNGYGKIRILNPGIWLIKAEHQEPYADPGECDVESFVATLTFEVK